MSNMRMLRIAVIVVLMAQLVNVSRSDGEMTGSMPVVVLIIALILISRKEREDKNDRDD